MPIRNGTASWLAWRMVSGLMLVLAACSPDPRSSASPAATPPEDHEAFLERHWQRRLPPQGAAPSESGPLEASLHPAACGSCHRREFEDWQTAVRIRVEPDAFYAEFYRPTLGDPGVDAGREAIRQALNHAERSGYVLYRSQQALASRRTYAATQQGD